MNHQADAIARRMSLDLAGGATLLLQRVPRGVTASAIASALSRETGDPARVVSDLDDRPGLEVWDARGTPAAVFAGWDLRRGALVPAGGRRVVLLDVQSAGDLLANAPHTASYAGGVTMTPPGAVRGAQTREEALVGERLLQRWIEEHPEDRGRLLGVDLASERVFRPRADASPLEAAREHLDEGIIYVGVAR